MVLMWGGGGEKKGDTDFEHFPSQISKLFFSNPVQNYGKGHRACVPVLSTSAFTLPVLSLSLGGDF